MKPEIIITLKSRDGLESLEELKTATDKGKLLDCEIKVHRERRSLDANAFLWVTLSKMAGILKTTKDELYLLMLERYGIFTHIIVKKEAVERVKSEWRTVRELGEGKIGNGTGVQLQVYYGSSTYDIKEMSRLLDGIVSEAHEIGIETPNRNELELMKIQWKGGGQD